MEIKKRQLEIIEAAGEILTESGLAGLTTKNLAAKVGFGESALYRHFKGCLLYTSPRPRARPRSRMPSSA